MTRTPYRNMSVIAAVLALLLQPGGPPAGREWHSWCGDPGSELVARLAFLLRSGRGDGAGNPVEPSEADAAESRPGHDFRRPRKLRGCATNWKNPARPRSSNRRPGTLPPTSTCSRNPCSAPRPFRTCSGAWSGRHAGTGLHADPPRRCARQATVVRRAALRRRRTALANFGRTVSG